MAIREQRASLDFLGTNRILNLLAPSDPAEPARLADLNAAIEGLKNKDPVLVKTQGNINLAAPGASIDGEAMSGASNPYFLAALQTAPEENGIYLWNGAATPATRRDDASTGGEITNALVSILAGTNAGESWRQTATIATIGTDAQTWIQFGQSVASASETTAGVAELATQAETDTGTDDARIVTPLKLATHSKRAEHGSQVIGDGSTTTFTITHNLNRKGLKVSIYRNSGSYDEVDAEVRHNNVNSFDVLMTPAPTSNQFVIDWDGRKS